MWFKHPAWVPTAWLVSAANVVAVWFAAAPGEPWHATVHAALGVGFALGARRLVARRREAGGQLQQALDQNEYLQETIDDLQPRLMELEERLDFAERLLASQRDAAEPNPRPGGNG